MKKRYFNAIIFLLLFLVTAFTGLYIGQNYLHFETRGRDAHSGHWHQKFHEKLNITSDQAKKLLKIEDSFSNKRKALEKRIYLANRELAQAIKKDKNFSLQVQQATNKIHEAMGELQKATLQHFFEMRPILTENQNLKLEKMVSDALENK
ncbi:MAG: periplasmic heavy metal sensor [Rhizobiales bacterium]|jgi:Spy/CpxP family protein refolding chaperone|nr:periplasmic heavy metal sensor [Hyphomicrobiales bacterium]